MSLGTELEVSLGQELEVSPRCIEEKEAVENGGKSYNNKKCSTSRFVQKTILATELSN